MNKLSAGRLQATLLLVSLMPFSTSYAAQSYIGLGGGITYAPKTHVPELEAVIDYDVGFRVGTFLLGRRFENGWRVDLEASYRRNELEIIRFDDNRPPLNTGTHNSVQALGLMVNGTYEFDFGLPIAPYVGAGFGPAGISFDISEYGSRESVLKDETIALAYQVYAGLMIPLGERWQIAADYRWSETVDFDMKLEAGDSVTLDYSSRLFNLSFRRLLDQRRGASAGERLPVESDRWYIDTRLGTAFAGDSDITNRFDTNFDAFDAGVAASLALGYSHRRPSGRRLRGELEVHGWENDADVIDFGVIAGEFPMEGSVEVRGAMLNALIDLAPNWKIRPHAGLGVGYSEVDYDVSVVGEGGPSVYVDDKHTGVAVQAILGFGMRLTERTELSLGWRYWLAPSIELIDASGDPMKTEHGTHLVMLGLRFGLGD